MKIKLMLMWASLTNFMSSLFKSAKGMEVMQTEQQEILAEPTPEVKEVSWFARENNLVKEFSHDPVPTGNYYTVEDENGITRFKKENEQEAFDNGHIRAIETFQEEHELPLSHEEDIKMQKYLEELQNRNNTTGVYVMDRPGLEQLEKEFNKPSKQ